MTSPSGLIAVATALLGAALAADERPGRWTTPDDVAGVVQALEEIRDGYRRNQDNLPWYRLQGTLQPDGREFVLARRNDQARFEVEYDHPNLGRKRLHCLTDNRSLMRLSHDALDVYPMGLKNVSWTGLCDGWDTFAAIPSLDEEGRQEIDEYCQSLIEFLQGRGKYRRYHDRVRSGEFAVTVDAAHAVNGQGTRTIRLTCDRNSLSVFEFTIDADRGYHFTDWRETQSNEDPTKYLRIETLHNDYRQLPNGAWILSSGRFDVKQTGTIVERDGRMLEWSKELRVESVETGDISVEPDYFSLKSLPINSPVEIHDHRYAPVLSRTAKLGGNDEEVLNLLADIEPDEQ